MIEIPGVRPSAEIREELAAGGPVLLAMSCGKDALAAWLALRDAGVAVVPYYLYLVPGLAFVDRTLADIEAHFGQRVARYPHPSLYRWLNAFTFQPPERCAVIEAAGLPEVTFAELVDLIREDLGVEPTAWVADGVRAADSPVRRVSIKTHGPMKAKGRKVSPIWDWRKADVLERIAADGLALPVDYQWFGRSFDGIDRRFLEPLARHAPEDFARVLDWFPLADLELVRHAL